MTPPYQRTADGFELTFATNHLGHFALTGLVLEPLLVTPGSRIVTVSSGGHAGGVMNFDDLQFERGYHATHAYWQSKLANQLFTYELQDWLGIRRRGRERPIARRGRPAPAVGGFRAAHRGGLPPPRAIR
jgi:NAD(P)-dependent dehydrogenase (short-subunit alcohol dehydrogenase family)